MEDIPFLTWLIIYLFDVPHVYSTLFRTYWHSGEMKKRRLIYLIFPFLFYGLHLSLYKSSPLLFWQYLAYFALFHFMRQQYGWMMIASFKAKISKKEKSLDKIGIYSAVIFPSFWWSTHPTSYGLFTSGDIIYIPTPQYLIQGLEILYWAYSIFYGFYLLKKGPTAMSRLQVWLTSWIVWAAAFYWFSSQTVMLVSIALSHCVPYLILLYLYRDSLSFFRKQRAFLPIYFYVLLLAISTMDTSLWWFLETKKIIYSLSPITAYIIPCLALPDALHYVFDTFLWKNKWNPGLYNQIQERLRNLA